MSCVTAVEGEWLAELGPMFFSIKESYETTLLRRQKDRIEQAKMEKEMAEKKRREEDEEKKRSNSTAQEQGRIARPGAGNRNKRFMPKKRGRLGL